MNHFLFILLRQRTTSILSLGFVLLIAGLGLYLFDASPTATIGTIGLILAVWLGLLLYAQYRVLQGSKALEQSLRAESAGPASGANPGETARIENLRSQLDEALKKLRASKAGKAALSTMPWFMIIGPPGSGKTTMLRASNLKFPAMPKKERRLQGIHGTKNCDWWFADKAILLDTAGRYTTQSKDSPEWGEFLKMLRRTRPAQPINGVVVAISMEELIAGSESHAEEHAETIRDRIDELVRELEVTFPVYVTFTKCDQLGGFVEFFGSLSKEDRSQAWGFTIPRDQGREFDLDKLINERLDELYGVLTQHRLTRLSADAPLKRKEAAYGLPLYFSLARTRIQGFLRNLNAANPYQDAAEIHGCFFTSGTQEGTAISEHLQKMYQIAEMNIEIPEGERRCYFVDELFEKIVFENHESVRPTGAWQKRQRRNRIAIRSSAAATLLLGCTASYAAYDAQNWDVLERGRQLNELFPQAKTAAYSSQSAAGWDYIDLLDKTIASIHPQSVRNGAEAYFRENHGLLLDDIVNRNVVALAWRKFADQLAKEAAANQEGFRTRLTAFQSQWNSEEPTEELAEEAIRQHDRQRRPSDLATEDLEHRREAWEAAAEKVSALHTAWESTVRAFQDVRAFIATGERIDMDPAENADSEELRVIQESWDNADLPLKYRENFVNGLSSIERSGLRMEPKPFPSGFGAPSDELRELLKNLNSAGTTYERLLASALAKRLAEELAPAEFAERCENDIAGYSALSSGAKIAHITRQARDRLMSLESDYSFPGPNLAPGSRSVYGQEFEHGHQAAIEKHLRNDLTTSIDEDTKAKLDSIIAKAASPPERIAQMEQALDGYIQDLRDIRDLSIAPPSPQEAASEDQGETTAAPESPFKAERDLYDIARDIENLDHVSADDIKTNRTEGLNTLSERLDDLSTLLDKASNWRKSEIDADDLGSGNLKDAWSDSLESLQDTITEAVRENTKKWLESHWSDFLTSTRQIAEPRFPLSDDSAVRGLDIGEAANVAALLDGMRRVLEVAQSRGLQLETEVSAKAKNFGSVQITHFRELARLFSNTERRNSPRFMLGRGGLSSDWSITIWGATFSYTTLTGDGSAKVDLIGQDSNDSCTLRCDNRPEPMRAFTGPWAAMKLVSSGAKSETTSNAVIWSIQVADDEVVDCEICIRITDDNDAWSFAVDPSFYIGLRTAWGNLRDSDLWHETGQ